MAVSVKTRRKKAGAPRVRKTGAAAVSPDRGYAVFVRNFHLEVENKDSAAIIKGYVRKAYDKATAAAILKNPEYKWNSQPTAAWCYWTSMYADKPFAEGDFGPCAGALNDEDAYNKSKEYNTRKFAELAESGKLIVKEERQEERKQAKIYKPSIQERMREQLSEIIGQFEAWFDEQPAKDTPKVFDWLKKNTVAQAHIGKIRSYYEPQQAEFKMLASKNCPEDLAEGYQHLTKKDIKQYLAWFDAVFADLDAYANLKRATRKTRVKKAPSKEKLISKLKYKKEDSRYKIVSIDPAKILDATELWVFNTKTRKIGKYVAEPNMTLGIKGTTLQCFSEHASVQKTLRKPEEKLKEFNKAGKVALRKFLEDINAVETKMTGRLNADIVILKAV